MSHLNYNYIQDNKKISECFPFNTLYYCKVFQHRQDGSVDFYRDWKTYQCTFGSLNGEFWLGKFEVIIYSRIYFSFAADGKLKNILALRNLYILNKLIETTLLFKE